MSVNDVRLWLARRLDAVNKLACAASPEDKRVRLSIPVAYDATYEHKMANAEALAVAALELTLEWRYYTIDSFHDYEHFILGLTVYYD